MVISKKKLDRLISLELLKSDGGDFMGSESFGQCSEAVIEEVQQNPTQTLRTVGSTPQDLQPGVCSASLMQAGWRGRANGARHFLKLLEIMHQHQDPESYRGGGGWR